MVAKRFNSAGCPTTQGGSIGLNDKKPYFVATSLMAQMPGFIISVVVIIALPLIATISAIAWKVIRALTRRRTIFTSIAAVTHA